MGRPNTPLEIMAARSPDGITPGKRNLPAKVTLAVDRSVPDPPSELQGRGLEEWSKVWTAGWWLVRDQDYPWVEMIARAYMDIEVFRQRVAEEGLIATGYAGQVVAHPLIAEIRKCEQTIQKCLSVLGFSPTDRARLRIQQNKERKALQQMIDASKGQ